MLHPGCANSDVRQWTTVLADSLATAEAQLAVNPLPKEALHATELIN